MMPITNNNDLELDRKSDTVENEPRTKPRVSGDDDVVGSSDKVTHGGADYGESVNLIGSEEIRVSDGDLVGSYDEVTHGGGGGNIGRSFGSTGSEEIRASMELENRAAESEKVRDLVGGVSADLDWKGIDEKMESRVGEIKNEDMTAIVDGNGFRDQSGGTEQLASGAEGNRVNSSVVGVRGELAPRAIDNITNARKAKGEHLGSSAGKGKVEVGISTVSQYDSMLSMFDEFAANGGDGALAVGPLKPLGYGYEVGDMVWGKVKSHPWWPGHIYSEAFASSSVRRSKREGHVLVAFFGDSSYGWFDPAELTPFDPSFAEKSRQTNSRTFVKAVEEAVDEASRRCSMGLACQCRNPYNFRPTNVHGYFAVDVGDYEPGGVYSANQIRKVRDSFRARETVAFIKQLALAPKSGNEHGGIHFIKNKATVLAYRKAVFEEFDETYAQAFGHQPVRPSRGPTQDVAQSVKEPSRAPLSGRLVIAEALGKGKSSAKPNKAKDKPKKDKYLFKRRDEPKVLKTHQINQGQATSSAQPVYVEGSLAVAAGDYVLQKRAPPVSIKPQVPAKHEQMRTIARDGSSGLSCDIAGEDVATTEQKPAVSKFSMAGSQINASKVVPNHASSPAGQTPGYNGQLSEARSPLDKGNGAVLEMKESLGSDVAVGPISRDGSGLVDDMPHTIEHGAAMIGFIDDRPSSTAFELVKGFVQPLVQQATAELLAQKQVQDGSSDAYLLGMSDAKLHGEGSRMRTDSGAKKVKVRKRPVGELSIDKSVPLEKKKKKKRKQELMSFVTPRMRASAGKDGASMGKVSGKSVQAALAPREGFQEDSHKKDDQASTSLLPDSDGTQQMVGMGLLEIKFPQLLGELQALALNPFHRLERSPAVIRQVFLKFRSLVYQKSLVSLPLTENESNETWAGKSPAVLPCDSSPNENVRDLPSLKSLKPPIRPDDPIKGGRKRGPSDRQEEMAAKKKKKINDVKILAAEKKAAQRTPEAQHVDGRETVAPIPKSVKSESVKKAEPLLRAQEPTMLVMKFPPRGTLPSLNELKARLARFGPLDPSGTRVFWKTSTCRVVYRHKLDAQTAYNFIVGSNNLFGNTNVRCHLRELGVAAPESENGTPPLRDSAVEQRLAAPLTSQSLQHPAVQLKSILKKSTGDEAGSVAGGNGGGRGTPRVKFMLGGEESSRGEQLMIGNKNNFNNNASFADGGASFSSHANAMDFNSKNFQKFTPPPPFPILPLPTAQFPRAPSNMHYTEISPRNAHNFNTPINPPTLSSSATNIDIGQQMLSLLTRCNDVVTNVTGFLGYVPYHPL